MAPAALFVLSAETGALKLADDTRFTLQDIIGLTRLAGYNELSLLPMIDCGLFVVNG